MSVWKAEKLSSKSGISAFSAQGSRGIKLAAQVGAVKIYVAVVEALREKKKTRWIIKIDGFLSFTPPWMLMYFFVGFLESHHVYDQTRGTGIVFS
jgi:hypothetical protein